MTLFRTPAIFQGQNQRLGKWQQVASKIQEDYPELYPLALSFFRKAIGGRKAEEADYMFVDAFDMLQIVQKLCNNGWSLESYRLNREIESGLRTTFSDVIDLVKTRKEDVFKDARFAASAYKAYFTQEVSHDLAQASVSAVIGEMKGFLSFLTSINMSYSHTLEDALGKSDLDKRLNDALTHTCDILECTDEATLLSQLSKEPFKDIEEIYRLFIDFDRLLNEKENTFVSGINQVLQDEIDNGLREAKDELNTMQALFLQLKEV